MNKRRLREICGSLLSRVPVLSRVKITSRRGFDNLLAEFERAKLSEARLQRELEAEKRRLRLLNNKNLPDLSSSRPDILHRADRPENRLRALIVATTASQLPHIGALADHAIFRKYYDPIVFAHLEIGPTGFERFCKERSLPLLDYKLRLANPGGLADLEHVLKYLLYGGVHIEGPGLNLPQPGSSDVLYMLGDVVMEVARQITIADVVSVILAYCGIDIVVLFEDNAEYDTGIWIARATWLQIPSLIIPFTIADQTEPAEAHYNNEAYDATATPLNQFVARAYPKWTHKHRDRLLLRRKAAAIIAAQSLYFAQPDPWVLNRSHATRLAVESQSMFDFYRRLGIPESRMTVTGSFVDDLAFTAENQRAQMLEALGLDQERPILLCSFPPNQLTAGRPECEFATFDELIDFWMQQLGKLTGWQVIVRPHPAMEKSDIGKLRRFAFVVSEMDTAKLIPLCDIYNASVSSTIRWALASGKPVLNFDVFNYRYRDFADEPAVLTTYSAQEFSGCIDRLLRDAEFLAQLSTRAVAAAPKWGIIDGQSGDRIVLLMHSMISEAKECPLDTVRLYG
jgi:hypothetical protein